LPLLLVAMAMTVIVVKVVIQVLACLLVIQILAVAVYSRRDGNVLPPTISPADDPAHDDAAGGKSGVRSGGVSTGHRVPQGSVGYCGATDDVEFFRFPKSRTPNSPALGGGVGHAVATIDRRHSSGRHRGPLGGPQKAVARSTDLSEGAAHIFMLLLRPEQMRVDIVFLKGQKHEIVIHRNVNLPNVLDSSDPWCPNAFLHPHHFIYVNSFMPHLYIPGP
jgi:hypothetical protein